MDYKNYTNQELKTALNQLERLIYTKQAMSDDICEVNKIAYKKLIEEMQERGIYEIQ